MPLKRCKRIRKPDGSTFTVNFKYERLHIFCFICGRLGHSERFCDQWFAAEEKEIKREWGVWLKVDDRRGTSLAGEKWLRSEEGAQAGAHVQATPVPETQRRGTNIFSFGNSGNHAGNPLVVNPRDLGNHSADNSAKFGEGVIGHNSADTDFVSMSMHAENDCLTLGEERKRRRGALTTGLVGADPEKVPTLCIAYANANMDTTSPFLSAGSGPGAGRDQ